jgi:hypothetical protein
MDVFLGDRYFILPKGAMSLRVLIILEYILDLLFQSSISTAFQASKYRALRLEYTRQQNDQAWSF